MLVNQKNFVFYILVLSSHFLQSGCVTGGNPIDSTKNNNLSIISASNIPYAMDTWARLGYVSYESRTGSINGSKQFSCEKVYSLDQYGSAKKAGINVGDHICSINNNFFNNSDDIKKYVSTLAPGSKITIGYVSSDGIVKYSDVYLSSFFDLSIPARTINQGMANNYYDRNGYLGIIYQPKNLNIRDARDRKDKYSVFSAEVSEVIKGGPSFSSALSAGDLIFSINGIYFSDQKSFDQYIRGNQAGVPAKILFYRPSANESYETTSYFGSRQAPPPEATAAFYPKTSPSPAAEPSEKSFFDSDFGKAALAVGLVGAALVVGSILFGSDTNSSHSTPSYQSDSSESLPKPPPRRWNYDKGEWDAF